MSDPNSPAEKLVWNDSFRRWVLQASPGDGAFWEAWLENNPDQVDLFLQAREIVLTLHAAQQTINPEEVEAEISRLTRTLRRHEEFASVGNRRRSFASNGPWFRAAAVVLLLVSGALYWYGSSHVRPIAYTQLIEQANHPMVEKANATNDPMLVNLSDGSTVILSPGSQISFPNPFTGDTREVFLQGEAFFEITKNPEQPFLVHANGLISKVLGTSFTIRAFEHDAEVQVQVKTGKVSVFAETDFPQQLSKERPELTGLILTPNQQVVFDRSNQRMIRTLVEEPAVVNPHAIQQQYFTFNKTPIAEVFAVFEQTYGVTIIYPEDLLKGCELTGELGDEPLLEKMNLICKTIGGSYEMIDAQIVVNGKGCQ